MDKREEVEVVFQGPTESIWDALQRLYCQLKASLLASQEKDAEIARLNRIVSVAKVDRVEMKAKLDSYNSGGFADADAMAGKYLEEKAIVDRVWKALGISTYEQAGGKAIDEIVASLRASVGGEKWIEIKEGCEMPPYGKYVWVIYKGVVQKVAYCRDIGEWIPFDGMGDCAPNGTFSHWSPIVAPPSLPTEEK